MQIVWGDSVKETTKTYKERVEFGKHFWIGCQKRVFYIEKL